jgi:hypothetical protein
MIILNSLAFNAVLRSNFAFLVELQMCKRLKYCWKEGDEDE